ncbi:MAG: glutamate--tRNA ligase [Candidatus Pacebacteria bacterium]|nr:glutamate--tRNA ligase [Candidatus Paceibacterota bacterium]
MIKPRVRFAPSPTGYLHIGGARTALFNFLFAKSQKGTFILRIEDTDKSRSLPEYEEDIIESLNWLGLYPDEEIVKQSQRLDLYEKVIKTLIDKGYAYYCFCTKEELEIRRQEQLTRGEPPRYSGKCKNLTKEEVNKKLSRGESYVIRLKVPEKIITFKDFLRGEIKFDFRLLGDFVIAKNERGPLYLLAAPVDDHYQGITHVIRGEDHIPNTPKQLLIFKYMEWEPPIFVHLPLILGPDGTKLSKRHGAKSIKEYRNEGYLPEALINFIALLGWHPEGDREIISLEEMIKEFKLEKINTSPARFNINKLIFFNRYYLRQKDSKDLLEIINFSPYGEFKGDNFYALNGNIYSKEKVLKIIEMGKERANTITEILLSVEFFFKDFDYDKNLLLWKNASFEEIKKNLEEIRDEFIKLKEEDFKSDKIKEVLDKLSQNEKGKYFWPLRAALTGKEASPPPFEIAEVFGKEKTISLIDKALEKLNE